MKKVETFLLHLARTWWRPVIQWSASLSIFVNGVYKPLILNEPIDLANLAILITAISPLIAIRGAEKHFIKEE